MIKGLGGEVDQDPHLHESDAVEICQSAQGERR